MENEKNNNPFEDSDWFDGLIDPAAGDDEIGTDEHAIADHDMASLSDIELEKIIQETLSEDWVPEDIAPESEPQPEAPADEEYSDSGQLPEAEESPSDDAEEEGQVTRKVRPKRKGGYGAFGLPHFASTAIWIILVVAIGISLGRLLWVCAADILAFGREDKEVVITITVTDTLDTVTSKLHNAGLIHYPDLFKMYAKLSNTEVGYDKDISVGTFTLNTLYDYHALVGGMSSGSSYRETKDVRIPEGYTCAQIYQLLEDNGICTVEALEQYASESAFANYWFLEGVEKGSKYCLEGFLFPDTYNFYTDSSPRQAFIVLLGGFKSVFTEEMKGQIDTLNERLAEMYRSNGRSEAYIEEHKLTLPDIVTIASMIEKESAHTGEIRDISSIIYNRLTDPDNFPHLQIDATVIYALGGKSDLTAEDLKVDSPYNTYVCEGLPAGPICNPSEFSLQAALNPSDSDYLFYILNTKAEIREHKFFKDYEDFWAFKNSLG